MSQSNNIFKHKTAEIDQSVKIGEGTKIWNLAQIREKTKIGKNCIISKNVYIDQAVEIGNNVKIQNNSSIYHGSKIEDNVFIGPHVILTNDKTPRATNEKGELKKNDEWNTGKILIKKDASIGAGSIILPNVTIGKYALVGAGSVVTKNIPDHGLTYGTPAVIKGYVCFCGTKLDKNNFCNNCKKEIKHG